MKCHYCGEEVAEGQNYCLWCGTRQEPEKTEPAQKQVEVPVAVPAAEPIWQKNVQQCVPVMEKLPEPVSVKTVEPATPTLEMLRTALRDCPRLQLPTRRGLGKMLFLGILTLGIYPVVIWSRIVTELNIAASRYDGKRTMPYFAMVMLTPLTLGIYAFVWMHKLCRRIGDELERRDLGYSFGPGTFWLWNVLGSLILVGPFVFTHKLMKAMNRINEDFNGRG
jgi:hypothetical protein